MYCHVKNLLLSLIQIPERFPRTHEERCTGFAAEIPQRGNSVPARCAFDSGAYSCQCLVESFSQFLFAC